MSCAVQLHHAMIASSVSTLILPDVPIHIVPGHGTVTALSK